MSNCLDEVLEELSMLAPDGAKDCSHGCSEAQPVVIRGTLISGPKWGGEKRVAFRALFALSTVALSLSLSGCRLFHRDRQPAPPAPRAFQPITPQRQPKPPRNSPIQSVVCLFDQKPWLSADAAGDRDPEGIQYRIFLNSGGNQGVARDGTFHIEMYRVAKDEKGERTRLLASDWHYPTSQFPQVSAHLLGIGYHVQLLWAKKDIAGSEVEIVTQFEDQNGNITRGATKRLRIPKYES